MKTLRKIAVVMTFSLGLVGAQAEDKTVGEKSAEVWDKTKQKTQEVTRGVVDTSKKVVERVESAIDKPDADARRVDVKVSEKGIQMPKTLTPGKTAFVVVNSGKEKHNFEIEGPHLDKSFWLAIAPQATKTMQVDLKAGTYEVHCNLHKEKEPKMQLTVK